MTTRECYEMIGADYEDALTRMLTDQRITKYTIKFLDEGSFAAIKKAMDEEDYNEAFKYAHNLKGICQNLSFSGLYEPVHLLTDALRERSRDIETAKERFAAVEKCYQETVSAIQKLKEETV